MLRWAVSFSHYCKFNINWRHRKKIIFICVADWLMATLWGISMNLTIVLSRLRLTNYSSASSESYQWYIEDFVKHTVLQYGRSIGEYQNKKVDQLPPGLTSIVKHDDHAMTWYDHGDSYSPWYDHGKIMSWSLRNEAWSWYGRHGK